MPDSFAPECLKSIDVLSIIGEGVLSWADMARPVRFAFHRQLSQVLITLHQADLGSYAFQESMFSLNGDLSDGRQVSVNQLRRISAKEDGLIELRPWNCPVNIGASEIAFLSSQDIS